MTRFPVFLCKQATTVVVGKPNRPSANGDGGRNRRPNRRVPSLRRREIRLCVRASHGNVGVISRETANRQSAAAGVAVLSVQRQPVSARQGWWQGACRLSGKRLRHGKCSRSPGFGVVAFHGLLDELQGGGPVSGLGNKGFQRFAFVIDGAPERWCISPLMRT